MRILITGGTGMVGTSFNNLKTTHKLIAVGSKDYDLTSIEDTTRMFQDNLPDAVIHLAAKVGGVKGNSDYMSEFFHKNLMINLNVLNLARIYEINKVVSLLSTCVYPDNPRYPLTEDQIHNGEPHKSNFGYAYAKRMLEVQSRAIRQQYGLNYITAIPNNLFGENDNFDLENGHVIPALIRKIYESKLSGDRPVLWGDGSPLREFTYSADISRSLIFLLENYNETMPVNVGNTKEISIRHLANTVSSILGYEGNMYTDLYDSLERTCQWFLSSYPNVRGV